MKLKNILFTSLLVTGLSYSADAQFVGDAFRFSQENSGGTARFKGLGNAKTALGGDISSITGNPAGLGFFGQSDMSITVNYNNANNKGTYFGNRASALTMQVSFSTFHPATDKLLVGKTSMLVSVTKTQTFFMKTSATKAITH